MKHIVIIGGGFGGVSLIKNLAGNKNFKVTLVDRNNYNFFPPLLYQVSTGFLEISNVCYPFRKLVSRMKNIEFRMGEFLSVDPEEYKVILSTGELTYDYLVFATGTSTNYFGMENVKKFALPMKTINDALNLRNHILLQLELASFAKDDAEREKLLNVVVVGGGPTGVEISGMLSDMKNDILAKDHPEISNGGYQPKIYLVDGLDEVLKPMSEKSHHYAFKSLTEMGVNVELNKQVKDYSEDVVSFTNGETINTKTLIWAAGVSGTSFEGIRPESYGRGKRLQTDPFNRINGYDDVFAIGDISLQVHEAKFPNGHPQMAQIAIQQGKNLAGNFQLLLEGKQMHNFAYHDKGSMAIIGRNKAVVDLPNKMHFNGFFAWFMWLFVHLLSLLNNRNKFTTLYNWTVAYFSKDQALRMIIRPKEE